MVNVDITASGNAAAEILAVQAAIDALHGKTVDVNVRVNKSGLGDIGALGRASDQAAASHERLGRASDRASASASAHARASERASSAVGGLGDSSARSASGIDRAGRSSDRTRDSLGGFSRSSRDADRSVSGLGDSIGGLGRGVRGLSDGMDGLGGGTRGASAAMSALSEGGGRASSALGTVGSAMVTIGTVGAYAAAGSGLLTAAVGALGVVGVGSLGAVGAAAGLAGGAMTALTVDAQKDSARFGKSFEQMGKMAHLGAQMISEPYAAALEGLGRSMVTADGHMTPAAMGIASSLREGFATAGDAISGSSGSIVESATRAARGFARLTDEAAPGVKAFLGELPPLTSGAVSAMSQVTTEFGRSAGQISGATPAINRMAGAMGGLGAELVHVGAGSAVPFAENMTQMTNAATRMSQNLEPAIKPSMQAIADVASAGMGGIGALSPEIADFARTVSAAAPGLQQGLTGVGKGMLAVGGAATTGLAGAGPALDNFGNIAQKHEGGLARLFQAGGDTAAGAGSAASALGGLLGNAIGAVAPSGLLGIAGGLSPAQRGTPGYGASFTGGPARGLLGYAGGGATGGGGGPVFAASWNGPQGAFAGPNGAPTPAGQAQTAQSGAANLFSNMASIPAGVAAAHTALSTLPTAAGQAMQQTHNAVQSANLGGAVASPMSKMMTKVQDQAAPAAAAGGAVGGAIGGGVGAGIVSTQTVVDTIIRRHISHIEDQGMGAADAHSPSRRFAKLGGYIAQGIGMGIGGQKRNPLAATSSLMDDMNKRAAEQRANKVVFARPGSNLAAALRARAAYQEDAAGIGEKKGAAKRAEFGEDPNGPGTRMVFDKQVLSFNARAGAKMGEGLPFSNDMVESPLSAAQQAAMEGAQSKMDGGGNANYQAFWERTQQNILRGRAGALDIAGGAKEYEERQKQQAAKLAENSTNPIIDTFKAKSAAVFTAGGSLAEAGHAGYKKKDQQNSPSAVWAGFGGNSVAGLAGGISASSSVATGAISGVTGSMQAVGDKFADRGLQVGFTWSENVGTGIKQQVKKADYQSAGLPNLDSPAALMSLASTGLLKAGAGAFVSKMTGNTPSRVSLAKPQNFTITHQLDIGGTMHQIATQVTLDMFGQVQDAVAVSPR